MPVAAGYVFWALFQVVHTAFYLREQTRLVTACVGVAAVANVALNALLVPRWGGQGAAWATLATFVLLALVAWRMAERVLPVGYETGRILAALALATALWGAGALLPGSGVATWALKLLLWLAYPAGLWIGGFLDREERGMIRRVFHP